MSSEQYPKGGGRAIRKEIEEEKRVEGGDELWYVDYLSIHVSYSGGGISSPNRFFFEDGNCVLTNKTLQ